MHIKSSSESAQTDNIGLKSLNNLLRCRQHTNKMTFNGTVIIFPSNIVFSYYPVLYQMLTAQQF